MGYNVIRVKSDPDKGLCWRPEEFSFRRNRSFQVGKQEKDSFSQDWV
jgi:hypothetical protein